MKAKLITFLLYDFVYMIFQSTFSLSKFFHELFLCQKSLILIILLIKISNQILLVKIIVIFELRPRSTALLLGLNLIFNCDSLTRFASNPSLLWSFKLIFQSKLFAWIRFLNGEQLLKIDDFFAALNYSQGSEEIYESKQMSFIFL